MTSCSAAATRRLAAALAPHWSEGTVIALHGDMGTGKSEFARGTARGFGISGPIPSPSFAILHVYDDGTRPLRHFDWYRTADESELYESGLDEFVGGEGLTLIEWPQKGESLLPVRHVIVALQALSETGRHLRLSRADQGPLPHRLLTATKDVNNKVKDEHTGD